MNGSRILFTSYPTHQLEGAPRLVCKVGFLRSNAANPLLLTPGFAFLWGHSFPKLKTENL